MPARLQQHVCKYRLEIVHRGVANSTFPECGVVVPLKKRRVNFQRFAAVLPVYFDGRQNHQRMNNPPALPPFPTMSSYVTRGDLAGRQDVFEVPHFHRASVKQHRIGSSNPSRFMALAVEGVRAPIADKCSVRILVVEATQAVARQALFIHFQRFKAEVASVERPGELILEASDQRRRRNALIISKRRFDRGFEVAVSSRAQRSQQQCHVDARGVICIRHENLHQDFHVVLKTIEEFQHLPHIEHFTPV